MFLNFCQTRLSSEQLKSTERFKIILHSIFRLSQNDIKEQREELFCRKKLKLGDDILFGFCRDTLQFHKVLMMFCSMFIQFTNGVFDN